MAGQVFLAGEGTTGSRVPHLYRHRAASLGATCHRLREQNTRGRESKKCSLHDGKGPHHPVGRTDGGGRQPQLTALTAAVCITKAATHLSGKKEETSSAMAFTQQAGRCLGSTDACGTMTATGSDSSRGLQPKHRLMRSVEFLYW